MKCSSTVTILTLLLCIAFSENRAIARSASEVGARIPGSRIAAGATHTCAVKEDGTVRCWGHNENGQLGDGTTTNRSSPVGVTGLTGAVAVSAGVEHTCSLLADGTVRCWGYNNSGQLGDGTTTNRLIPVQVPGLTNVVSVTAGGFHTCALLADDTLRCWGNNLNGQLGNGNTTTPQLMPVQVTGLTNVLSVTAGAEHTCALLRAGFVSCWGKNGAGQLGDGTTTDRSSPIFVAIVNVVAVSAGDSHTCASVAAGTVQCWGSNDGGELGDGTQTRRLTPVQVTGLTNAVSVTAGGIHTCSLLADGTVRCWGYNGSGQLGDGTTTNRSIPVQVSGLNNALAIAAALGGSHTCALQADDTALCWGKGDFGQLGNGSQTDATTPQIVLGGNGSISGRGITAGFSHTCARRADSTSACWGGNDQGQLGNGQTTVQPNPNPIQVRTSLFTTAGLTNFVAVAAGNFHSCGLLVNGTVRCWGDNFHGQLGDGTTADRLFPVQVTGITDAIAIAAGGQHTCALRVGGAVLCWGLNDSGQVGDGTDFNKSSPVLVTGLNNVVAIAAGAELVVRCGSSALFFAGASTSASSVTERQRRALHPFRLSIWRMQWRLRLATFTPVP